MGKMIVFLGNIEFIEADIVLGTLIGDTTGTKQPVMGHPPIETSDISLSSFLQQILTFNNAHSGATKGVKLDFKTIEVFSGSLDLLISLWDQVKPIQIKSTIILHIMRPVIP